MKTIGVNFLFALLNNNVVDVGAVVLHGAKSDHKVRTNLLKRHRQNEDPAGIDDRLADDCQEPDGYGESYDGAFGPEKIHCCRTAKKVYKDLEQRCGTECEDAHPCSKNMQEVFCPKALKKYKAAQEAQCKPRPTTTTESTTTEATTEAPTTTTEEVTTTTKDPLEWCYKMCQDVAQGENCKDEDACEAFCKKAAQKFEKMEDKPATDSKSEAKPEDKAQGKPAEKDDVDANADADSEKDEKKQKEADAKKPPSKEEEEEKGSKNADVEKQEEAKAADKADEEKAQDEAENEEENEKQQ